MNDLEGLMIYKQYLELIYYIENITLKYPKYERDGLVFRIKNITYDGIKDIIYANKEFNKGKRVIILNNLDVNLKMLKVMIRVSYKKRYISVRNYNALSKKIYNINNLMFGWIKSCQRV